ncbi:protein MANBAL-like [Tympanuchus pallidicinctus]|uniref:protein MANBAL-like n=1 Tax=Tympanuchus pallidicinctus TaxID=109042 RepID=UPI002286CF60|nr:protein MANBAL-like [Tympanuchus pallidicinctus]
MTIRQRRERRKRARFHRARASALLLPSSASGAMLKFEESFPWQARAFLPAEIPEPTLAENVLRHHLFCGATLQLLCALAVIVPVSRCHKPDWHSLGTLSGETVKKAKASAALLRKKAQKESKKNREGLEREGPQDTRISWNASSEVAPKAAD